MDKFEEKDEEETVCNIILEQEKDCYKPLRVCAFYSNIYIEYESNSDRNKTLSIK